MASFLYKVRCDNCGAEYRLNSRGVMLCPFCGSVYNLNDKDFEEFLKTRDEMLQKERFTNDDVNQNGDVLGMWNDNNVATFKDNKGNTLNCRYSFLLETYDKLIYVAKNKVTVIGENSNIYLTSDMLDYPSADIKRLDKYLPNLIYQTVLEGGNKVLTTYSKDENVYPLGLFDNLDAKTVAWITSRLENLNCLFEFNEFLTTRYTINECYINPKTHELYLIGLVEKTDNFNRPYMVNAREISKSVLNEATANQMYLDFLCGPPASDAYTDFKNWDNVIEKGFNGHNFHRFERS